MPGIVDCYHSALTNLQGPYMNNCPAGHPGHELPGAAGRRDARPDEVGQPEPGADRRLVLPDRPADTRRPDHGRPALQPNIASCNSLPVNIGDLLVDRAGQHDRPDQPGRDRPGRPGPGRAHGTAPRWSAARSASTTARASCRSRSSTSTPTTSRTRRAAGSRCRSPTSSGFFVEQMQGNDVTGILLPYRAQFNPGAATVVANSVVPLLRGAGAMSLQLPGQVCRRRRWRSRPREHARRRAGLRPTAIATAALAALAQPTGRPAPVLVVDVRGTAQFPAALPELKRTHPQTAIVLVAGALDTSLMLEAIRCGVTECVVEPVTQAELVARCPARQRAAGGAERRSGVRHHGRQGRRRHHHAWR